MKKKNNQKTFLIEIGTEELPAKSLYEIAHSFYTNFIFQLQLNHIAYKKINWFATPRRIALQVINIHFEKTTIEINKKGPTKKDAFDTNGQPSQAAYSWAKKNNIDIKKTTILKNKKGEWMSCKILIKKELIELLLPKINLLALQKIDMQKKMRWNSENEKFFRPIRNIVMLLDKKILTGNIYNIPFTNFLYNHINAKEKKIIIQHALQYPSILFDEYKIIANYQDRKDTIKKEIKKIIYSINGKIKINKILLEEVTSLVESPKILLARFKKNFLSIPRKILVHTIEHHQKCFPIYNLQKKLLPYFIFVSNIHSSEEKNVITGNERVMHARLSDTAFFLKKDQKNKLEKNLINLKKVIFKKEIGTLYDKTIRLQRLVKWIASYTKSNIENSIRAATLSKCDLISELVCEFPDLQGVIGMYYAIQDNEKKEVAIALKEQYRPAFSEDQLPSSIIGCTLSIADKMDTLSGMFLIGYIPKSDKDPFALRRLALGIIKIIIQQKIPLNLNDLIEKSIVIHKIQIDHKKIKEKIKKFFFTRLFYLYEEKKYNIKNIKSVLSYQSTNLVDVNKRIQAIAYFQNIKNYKNVILLIKRISKILEKNTDKLCNPINYIFLTEKSEKILFNNMINFQNQKNILLKKQEYKKILLNICKLEKLVYNFFENVQIFHNDSKIRINRLTLLNNIHETAFQITDFNYLY